MLLPQTCLTVEPKQPIPMLRGAERPSLLLARALGAHLHTLSCTRGCTGVGQCDNRGACAFGDLFHLPGDRPPPMHIDAVGLDMPGTEARRMHLRVFSPQHQVLAGATLRQVLQQGLGRLGLAYTVVDEQHEPFDVLREASAFDIAVRLFTASPMAIKGLRGDADDLSLVLRATYKRGRDLGLPMDELPRCDHRAPLPVTRRQVRQVRVRQTSRSTQQNHAFHGLIGAWDLQTNAAQRAWLSLATAIGVGKQASRGFGVVGLEPPR